MTVSGRVLAARLDSIVDVLISRPAIRAVAAPARQVALLCGPRGRAMAGLPQRLGADPASIWVFDDLPQRKMHAGLVWRRIGLHPFRWTSLGLSLLEAMLLGMPAVALATTGVVEAVPPEAGVVSSRLDVLTSAVRRFVSGLLWPGQAGQAARPAALGRYSLARFHRDGDRVLRGEISR
jgi:glycosyltransferase involved in cell wall biosynthesis